ncbi:tigger transposable element-derived protein 6-like protein [Elysia marginata]|uniref:Tigger transposable element-derived protein 6-like protein n=1 Tax=Elysia marginata TaxID=1093978 RepID=A0AAV4EF49_9GAST|nr:tigger transposable element-derived protein 6-like protein [Elysia marginata]
MVAMGTRFFMFALTMKSGALRNIFLHKFHLLRKKAKPTRIGLIYVLFAPREASKGKRFETIAQIAPQSPLFATQTATGIITHGWSIMPRYSKNMMKEALEAVQSGRLSINQAAKEYAIPRRTLGDKVRGVYPMDHTPKTVLIPEEEKSLVAWVVESARRGCG